ncbi:hypothetical protein AQ941_27740 [Burkholderia pseudomallei]|nr:hypothetical protein AQ941_27740 [Burkholderia pseudomallei]ONE00890.1 hypothetical protein AQ942_01965 [Burkholderia pseudomallei]
MQRLILSGAEAYTELTFGMSERERWCTLQFRNSLLGLVKLDLLRFNLSKQSVQSRLHETQHGPNEQRRVTPRPSETEAFTVSPVIEPVEACPLVSDAPSEQMAPLERLVRAGQ